MTGAENIQEHMEVVGSCGQCVGRVDGVERDSIKLTRDSPEARGEHRYVPLSWVERVDRQVHLSKPCQDVQAEWQAHPVLVGEYLPDVR